MTPLHYARHGRDGNPLPGVSRDSGLRGEFGAAQTGLHHSPALSLLCKSSNTPRCREAIRNFDPVTDCSVSSTDALGHFGQKSGQAACRTKQGIAGKR